MYKNLTWLNGVRLTCSSLEPSLCYNYNWTLVNPLKVSFWNSKWQVWDSMVHKLFSLESISVIVCIWSHCRRLDSSYIQCKQKILCTYLIQDKIIKCYAVFFLMFCRASPLFCPIEFTVTRLDLSWMYLLSYLWHCATDRERAEIWHRSYWQFWTLCKWL